MTADAAIIERLKSRPDTSALRQSLDFYYGQPERESALDEFYTHFVKSGDLVFDIGSHVGDRVGSFRRLGARVVAVEPQPACLAVIRAIYGDDDLVTVVGAACGSRSESLRLQVNSANPTVSTASTRFVQAAEGAGGWEDQVWDAEIEVPCTTLDELIAGHGAPSFTKIDVEGFEDAVLAGLSRPLPALSFEFTTIERAVAVRCLDRLTQLGFADFNVALGESLSMTFPDWLPAADMATHLLSLPHEANSGDVYCRYRA